MTKSDEEREEKERPQAKVNQGGSARSATRSDAEGGDTDWQLGELWVAGSLAQGRYVQRAGRVPFFAVRGPGRPGQARMLAVGCGFA